MKSLFGTGEIHNGKDRKMLWQGEIAAIAMSGVCNFLDKKNKKAPKGFV